MIGEIGLKDATELRTYFGSDAIHSIVLLGNDKLPDLAKLETLDDLEKAQWPQGADAFDINLAVSQKKKARATGLAVYGGLWASLFTHSRRMMGEEKYLIEMACNPDLIEGVIHRLTQVYLEAGKVTFEACKDFMIYSISAVILGRNDRCSSAVICFADFLKLHLKAWSDRPKSAT